MRERFDTVVEAPASLVLETACGLDLQSLPLARLIFRLRELLLRARPSSPRRAQGILEETLGLGWGLLARDEQAVVVGARCQPWRGDVTFTALAPEAFAAYAEPDQVKIAWTLEVQALGPTRTRFAHETRVVATDAAARRRFQSYWRWARLGILTIRYLMMPAVRRRSEALWVRRQGAGP